MIKGVLFVMFVLFLQLAIVVGLIWISWVYFDRRYKTKNDGHPLTRPDPGYEPTAEVFIDPKDGKRYRVFFNQASGDRQYVEEP